jgi:Xaa-Pro aminopeptidase
LADHLPRLNALLRGRKKIGYESDRITEARAQKLRSLLPKHIFVAFSDLIAPQMQIKDAGEVALIEKAARIADDCFASVLQYIKPGVRERDIAAELEYQMQKAGSEDVPFGTIVASGPRSALPHGRASVRRIKSGEFVTLDFGATVGGYVSDITRTVVMDQASPRQRRVYGVVRRAQQTALHAARSGMVCSDLDKSARNVIKRAGHGPRFGHGLGHGIGLAVHEGPSVNAKSNTVLRPGMVITIEPGVYFPGWGGVRIEDDIVIGRGGNRVLTRSDRELVVL